MVDCELDHHDRGDHRVCQGELFTFHDLILLEQLRKGHLLQGRSVRFKHTGSDQGALRAHQSWLFQSQLLNKALLDLAHGLSRTNGELLDSPAADQAVMLPLHGDG